MMEAEQPKEQTRNKAAIIANLSNQLDKLTKTTEALSLPMINHKEVADHIRVVNMLITESFQALDAEMKGLKTMNAELKKSNIDLARKIKDQG